MDKDQKKSLSFEDEKIAEISKQAKEKGKVGFEEKKTSYQNEKPIDLDENNPEKKDEEKVVIKNLRTYQGDVAEAINKNKSSVLSITLAEKRKQDQEKKETLKRRSFIDINREATKRFLAISASVFLVVLGITAVVSFYILQKNPTPTESLLPIDNTIIPFDKRVVYKSDKIDRQSFSEIIKSLKTGGEISPKSTLYIALTTSSLVTDSPITPKDFFSKMQTQTPSSVLRSFGKRIMVGLLNTTKPELFILVELSSFENSFAGMLEWENRIHNDIGILFSKQQEQTSGLFEDITIRNKDARILKNSAGEVVLLYSFLDTKTLLITESLDVFREMVGKISSFRLLR